MEGKRSGFSTHVLNFLSLRKEYTCINKGYILKH
jgi:hypothetical protein